MAGRDQASPQPFRAKRWKHSTKSARDRSRWVQAPGEQLASAKLLVGVLHQCADTDAQHEAEQENSAAAHDHWQDYGHHCAADVCLVAAADSDAIGYQSPNEGDKAAATWNDDKQTCRAI